MSLSAADMAAKIHANIAAVGSTQIIGAGSIDSQRLAWITALCQGIIDEITSNAVVHTIDSRGDVCNNGTIT